MQLRLATLNVWALPEPISRHLRPRLAAIGERLATLEADLVLLQEVWVEDARTALVAAGRRAGFAHAWFRDATLEGGGLVVLSRLPVLDARFERFAVRGVPHHLRHIDFLGGKGFVHLRVATARGPLSVVNTHLQAPYRRDVQHAYRPHRAAQAVQLALRCREWPEPLVVAGDFNFDEGEPGYEVLVGLTGLRDAAVRLTRREPTVFSGNPYRRAGRDGRRIDLVFTRDGGRRALRPRAIRRVFDTALAFDGEPANYSDHAGVWVELELAAAADAPSGRVAPEPDPRALRLAAQLLAEGHRDGARRLRGSRTWAGAGVGGAALAALGMRMPSISRRRLLRLGLSGAGFAALTPGVALSVLSEIYVPDEMRAFEALAARLVELGTGGR